jgi:hypothetical protein
VRSSALVCTAGANRGASEANFFTIEVPMASRRWLVAAVVATACAAGAGCAVTTADGRRLRLASSEFRVYAEQVFREQNRVASDLAFALEAPAPASDLIEAEESLLAACSSLNAVASARRDGESSSLAEQTRAGRNAPRCEAAIAVAEAALERSRR